jgi:hypothetical protein
MAKSSCEMRVVVKVAGVGDTLRGWFVRLSRTPALMQYSCVWHDYVHRTATGCERRRDREASDGDLKALCAELRYRRIETFIGSRNVVFDWDLAAEK